MRKNLLFLSFIALTAVLSCGQIFAQGHKGKIRLVTKEVSLGMADPGIIDTSLMVSPDSRRLAYLAQHGDKWLVVVDGQEGKEYDGIGALLFSPDGQRVAYGAQHGAKWLVVVEGQEGKKYDGISEGTPLFSGDSRRVAYGAQIGAKWLVVVDGQYGKIYDFFLRGSRLIFDSSNALHNLSAWHNEFFRVEISVEE